MQLSYSVMLLLVAAFVVDNFAFDGFVFARLLVGLFRLGISLFFGFFVLSLLLIELGANRHRHVVQRLGSSLKLVFVLCVLVLLSFGNGIFERLLVVTRDFVLKLIGHFLCPVDGILEVVLGINYFTLFLVFVGVELSFLLRLLDVFFAHVARVLDGDRLFFACAFILSGNTENTIGINIEGHFNLRHTTRCWCNTVKHETAQALVVVGKLALTLQDVNLHLWLVVGCG